MKYRKPTSLLEGFFLLSSILCSGAIFLIFLVMLYLCWPLVMSGQLYDLLLGSHDPLHGLYGIFPMIVSSLLIALLALCISFPMSIATACVVTTLAPRRMRKNLMFFVRLMAGIPTVVYGFVAIFMLIPFMRESITGGSGLNIVSAAIILSLLIAPTMIVLFVNGIHNVPKGYSLAMDGLGCTPVQKVIYLYIPQVWPIIISGLILGFGRAMGDTLVSLMLAGNSVAVPAHIGDSGRTLTAHIALVIAADFESMEFKTIFACGIVLYLFTCLFVVILRMITRGLVEKSI